MQRIVALACTVLAGLLLYKLIFASLPVGYAAVVKFRGKAPDCPWNRILEIAHHSNRFEALRSAHTAAIQVRERDTALGAVLCKTSTRPFWIKEQGDALAGKDLLAYLLAEHDLVAEVESSKTVRPGDIVFDCGAHVGVFTSKALKLGAKQVIMIEPEPVNVECLRRNFAAEIASGRAVLVPKGVWNEEKTLHLSISKQNSGSNSMIPERMDGPSIEVPVTTIDKIAESLHLQKVDFIKLDIEGAEREALSGGRGVLGRFRPRLMIDAYHLADDGVVLPKIIRRENPGYVSECGPCELGSQILPHVLFFL